MAINVNITSVVGTPPYLAWVCDSDAVNNVCVFISSFSTIPFTFTLPEEFETAGSYCIKVIDAESCENYECFGNLSSPSPTPTVTPTNSVTPSVTPSITVSPSATPSITVSPSATPSITVSPSVTPTPSTSGTLEDNTFQFLSAASENVLILRKNIHTINANIGDYVSGTTYPSVEKTGRAFNESITWSQSTTPMPTYNLAYNKGGQLVEFPNTVYKLISFDEFKSTPNGQSNQYMCLLPKFDNSGNTVNYNFTTVPEQDLEITPFSGTVKIRYDIAKASADLGYSYEDVEERFTLIAGQVEDFFSDSDLDFTVDFDVFLHTGTTFYDNMSLASYYEYHRDRGGIFENTGYHLGGIMSPGVTTAGGAYLGSKYFSIGGSGSFNMRTWPYTHETIIHEIGHCFGLQHAFTRTFRYMPGQEDGYWAQSNSSTLKDIQPLSGYPRGDYMSSKSSDKFNANERFSIMAYAGNSYVGDGSARNAASALRVYPRSGTTYNRDGDNGIQFDARFKTDNGTSPSRRQGNVNYIDFIDDNTFSQGELTAVTCNFESRIERHYIYSAPGTINVSLSGDVISDTGYTVNMFEIDGSGLTENYSAYSFTITGQNLNNVFDYNNQSDFGVKFQVKTEDDNTHRISLNYDITLDFYSSGGTNDLLSLKPRELFTASYTDDTLSQIEDKYLSSGYVSTHYTRDTFTPYEVRIVKSYANRLKNYFSE